MFRDCFEPIQRRIQEKSACVSFDSERILIRQAARGVRDSDGSSGSHKPS